MSENNLPAKNEDKLKANEFILMGVHMNTPSATAVFTVSLIGLFVGLTAISLHQGHYITIKSVIAIITGALTGLISGAYGISLSRTPLRSAGVMLVIYMLISNMVFAAAGDLITASN